MPLSTWITVTHLVTALMLEPKQRKWRCGPAALNLKQVNKILLWIEEAMEKKKKK